MQYAEAHRRRDRQRPPQTGHSPCGAFHRVDHFRQRRTQAQRQFLRAFGWRDAARMTLEESRAQGHLELRNALAHHRFGQIGPGGGTGNRSGFHDVQKRPDFFDCPLHGEFVAKSRAKDNREAVRKSRTPRFPPGHLLCPADAIIFKRNEAGAFQMQLTGIHHLTAITADVTANKRFYTETLGLRLVKKTVNQDDTSAYHLFYADGEATPGTDLTFFDWPVERERRGTRSISRTGLRVSGEASLDYWAARFKDTGVTAEPIRVIDG